MEFGTQEIKKRRNCYPYYILNSGIFQLSLRGRLSEPTVATERSDTIHSRGMPVTY